MAFEGAADKLKGTAKEAAGKLSDDKSLENEGKASRLVGDAKDKVNEAADSVKDKANEVAAKVEDKLND